MTYLNLSPLINIIILEYFENIKKAINSKGICILLETNTLNEYIKDENDNTIYYYVNNYSFQCICKYLNYNNTCIKNILNYYELMASITGLTTKFINIKHNNITKHCLVLNIDSFESNNSTEFQTLEEITVNLNQVDYGFIHEVQYILLLSHINIFAKTINKFISNNYTVINTPILLCYNTLCDLKISNSIIYYAYSSSVLLQNELINYVCDKEEYKRYIIFLYNLFNVDIKFNSNSIKYNKFDFIK